MLARARSSVGSLCLGLIGHRRDVYKRELLLILILVRVQILCLKVVINVTLCNMRTQNICLKFQYVLEATEKGLGILIKVFRAALSVGLASFQAFSFC